MIPGLSPDEQAAFARGVAQYDEGLFFECHDTLEEIWQGLRGPSRDFLQGLIQVAVAFHHLDRGNLAGAASVLTRALQRLDRYPADYAGMALGEHRDALRAWLARVRAGDVAGLTLAEVPRWRFP